MATRAAVSPWAMESTRESERPARRTVTGGGALASLSCRSPQVRTESPFTVVMRSPRRNAANEVAVELFLEGRIRFGRIAETIARVLDAHRPGDAGSLAAVLATDAEARRLAREAACR